MLGKRPGGDSGDEGAIADLKTGPESLFRCEALSAAQRKPRYATQSNSDADGAFKDVWRATYYGTAWKQVGNGHFQSHVMMRIIVVFASVCSVYLHVYAPSLMSCTRHCDGMNAAISGSSTSPIQAMLCSQSTVPFGGKHSKESALHGYRKTTFIFCFCVFYKCRTVKVGSVSHSGRFTLYYKVSFLHLHRAIKGRLTFNTTAQERSLLFP